MITCSCNIITEREIEQAITGLLDEEEWRLVVPAQVYHTMAKRGKCCGCFPNVSKIIIRVTEEYHLRKQTPDNVLYSLMERLKSKHILSEEKRKNGRNILLNQAKIA